MLTQGPLPVGRSFTPSEVAAQQARSGSKLAPGTAARTGITDPRQIAPPPPTPPTPTRGGPGTQIDPNNSLRTQAFLPPQDTSLDPATQRARTLIGNQLETLQGPDRQQLALDAYTRFNEASLPQYQRELQDVGRRAAALGRVGAGMTTSDLGDVQQRREEMLGRERGRLAGEAASLSLQDRLSALGGLTGGASSLAGLGQMEFGRGQASRDELRGERGYQDYLANSALDRRIQQEQLERSGQAQDFSQDLARRQFVAGLGSQQGYSPYANLQAASYLGPTSDPFSTFASIGNLGGGGYTAPPLPELPELAPQPPLFPRTRSSEGQFGLA